MTESEENLVATAGPSDLILAPSRPLICDFVFNRDGGEPVLQLKSDGTIVVTGDHDEVVRMFLSRLGEVYNTLPARLKEAEDEAKRLKYLVEEFINATSCMCNVALDYECVKCEAKRILGDTSCQEPTNPKATT